MIIIDTARKETDKKLSEMEKELIKIYQKALKQVTKKWYAYMDEINEELKELQKNYEIAKTNGDKYEKKRWGILLAKAKKKKTIQNEYYQEMVENLANGISKVNQTAVAYLNKKTPDIYVINYNAIRSDAVSLGIDFSIVDSHTVKRLVESKKIFVPKDVKWNVKQINSSVLQGILQGESIPKIADRIINIIKKNKDSSIRVARTMVTAAECGGRLDSYRELESMGVIQKKVWIATPDSRTRPSHIKVDGEEVDINQKFSNGCMFPGDSNAPPSEVWGCRCSIRTHIIGFKQSDGSISYVEGKRDRTMHDKQIEEEKIRREKGYNENG